MEKVNKSNLSMTVVQRMMNDIEFEAFWKRYKESRRGGGGSKNRFMNERNPLTDQEEKFLFEYFNSQEKTMSDLAEQYNYNRKSITSKTYSLLIRYCWLNKEKIGF